MRIAMRYAGLFAVLMSLGLGLLYWSGSRYVDEQIITGLQQRMRELKRIDQEKGRRKLIDTLNSQKEINSEYPLYFLLLSSDGQNLAGNLISWPPYLESIGRVVNVWMSDKLIPAHEADAYWPMIAEELGDGSRLLLAQSLAQAEELQEVMLYTIFVIQVVSVVLVLTMGWFIGRTMLLRVDHITNTAKTITSGDFSQRIPLSSRKDEFDQLALRLNHMLQQIEQLLNGMRQVTDNIAHDLRKPLSRLRNRLEITLLEKRDGKEYRQVLTETIEDADDMIRTFNALLEIAQTEAGSFQGEWKPIDMTVLLDELGELYRELAESQDKQLDVIVESNLRVTGNRHLLAQAVSNLLDNAIKYTRENDRISLKAEQHAKGVHVQIGDNGPGIPVDKHALVFERFTRLDIARSTSGSGLGLSLVKAVMQLHQVDLKLEDNQPGLLVHLFFGNNEE